MKLGILKEKEPENRVVLMPDSVKALINLKAELLVEKDAGEKVFVTNDEYKKVGATIVDRKTILADSDLILSVNALSVKEISSLDSSKVLIAAMNPFGNKEVVDALVAQKVTSFSLELVPRISRAQAMDILSSMATIAGYRAVLDAALHLPRFFPMFMSAAGTIKPAKMLILGAGVAGLQAIAIARKLGAVVEVFDVRSAVKEEVMSLGGKFVEVEGATEDAAAGGYAVEQTEEFKKRQGELIQQHVIKSDVVICTAQIPGRKAPVLIEKESVEKMQDGSIIIDLAASTGGNCELTKNDKTIVENGVTIIGNSNYQNGMQIDASSMFGRNVTNLLKLFISEEGGLNLNFEDEIIQGSCLTKDGEIINERVKSMNRS
jgi:H+-translocating NAD(P) transhydrogenase subunit alpha